MQQGEPGSWRNVEGVWGLSVASEEVEERAGIERANHFIELALSERRRVDRRTLLVDPNDPCGYSACRLTSPLNYLRGICPEQCVQLIRKFRRGPAVAQDFFLPT